MNPELYEIRNRLASIPEPAWIREMRAYYREHGHYRPEHLDRLLGDLTRAVEVGPRPGIPENYACRT